MAGSRQNTHNILDVFITAGSNEHTITVSIYFSTATENSAIFRLDIVDGHRADNPCPLYSNAAASRNIVNRRKAFGIYGKSCGIEFAAGNQRTGHRLVGIHDQTSTNGSIPRSRQNCCYSTQAIPGVCSCSYRKAARIAADIRTFDGRFHILLDAGQRHNTLYSSHTSAEAYTCAHGGQRAVIFRRHRQIAGSILHSVQRTIPDRRAGFLMFRFAADIVIDKSTTNSRLAAALHIAHYSQFLRGIRSGYIGLFDRICLGVFHHNSR